MDPVKLNVAKASLECCIGHKQGIRGKVTKPCDKNSLTFICGEVMFLRTNERPVIEEITGREERGGWGVKQIVWTS